MGSERRKSSTGSAGRRRARLGSAAALATLLALAATARADTGNIVAPSDPNNPQVGSGWQAGTCAQEPPEATNYCSIATEDQFFEQAGGHPQWGFTQIIVKHEPPGETPVGQLKTVRVDLPVGLSVNPQATTPCKLATFESNPSSCPATSAVGKSLVWSAVPLIGIPIGPLESTVYDLEPVNGEPARFGFELATMRVYLQADIAWEGDYHEGFTIDVPEAPSLEPIVKGLILKQRLVFNGRSGDGTFITTPTTCLGPPTAPAFEHSYSTWLRADSYSQPDPSFPNGSTRFESPIPDFTFPKECDSIPFEPTLEADPNTARADSPSGASVKVNLPVETPSAPEKLLPKTKQMSSHVKSATVTLPQGMGLNPSAANGLVACTDEQFGKGSRNPVACPDASRVGTVQIETPPLPPESLEGGVYVGQQLSRDPTSGQEYRIFVDAESARYGISARLVGNVSADPQTGQLSTTFADTPQVPFSTFWLRFNGGDRAPLTTPGTCGPHTANAALTPWSATPGSIPAGEEGGPNPVSQANAEDEFELTEAAAGGACPKALGERPFAPSFLGGTANHEAGAYSPFHVDLSRPDGQQELKGVEVQLPPGLTAKIAGVKYCPESAIAAAAANSGLAEAASSSCPASSLVGSASVSSGTGGEPITINGKAFLAGPYHGAPLSLAIVTPATAGPFDLGSVVVRVALFVDSETARVRTVTDPIPHVFGGTLLDIRGISVRLDRTDFSLNPTNCSLMAIEAALHGGGANPADPGAFTTYSVSRPFQVQNCDRLGFGPKLSMRVFGAMRRAKNPGLQAVVTAKPGEANIAKAAVTLPKGVILDQSSIGNVCTRVQFSAHQCPADSVYGFARAYTPLLDKPLEGPVRLRSSDNLLPDLVASLHGQLDFNLVGRNDAVNGRLRNTFEAVPDVPVEKFELTVAGGKKGLLLNTRDLCPHKRRHHKRRHRRHGAGASASRAHHRGKGKHRHRKAKPMRAHAVFVGQNGKQLSEKPKLERPCTKKKRGHHKPHRRQRARG